MPAWSDIAAIAVRAISILVVLEACGLAFFLYGLRLAPAAMAADLRRQLRRLVEAAAILTIVQHALAPARLAGSFDGIADASLQAFYLQSDAGTAHGIRLAGLVVVALGAGLDKGWLAVAGAMLACLSFIAMGHTVTHDPRWLLAPLLAVHVIVLAGWFGALRPLGRISATPQADTAIPLERFSRCAVLAVPILFASGIALALVLLPSLAALFTPYGFMLIAKLTAFAALMGLASVNRSRLVPRIRSGDGVAAAMFRRFAGIEWLLIALVILGTETVTSLTSP